MSAKRKKRKFKKPEPVLYYIDINDWGADYGFGVETPRKHREDDYWEHINLNLHGEIIYPVSEKTSMALIKIKPKIEIDDCWKEPPSEKPPKIIGIYDLPRDNSRIQFICWIPARSFQPLCALVAGGKIKYATVQGSRMKWRQGEIYYFELTSTRDEEEAELLKAEIS